MKIKIIINFLIFTAILISCNSKGSSESSNQVVVEKNTTTQISEAARVEEIPVYPVTEIGDGGLISKQPCGPPCFMGITPEITTKDEVQNFLDKNTDMDRCKIWDSWPDSRFYCNPVEVTFQQNLVDTIYFPNFTKITMKDLLETYGKPDSIYVSSTGDVDGNIDSVYMDIYYSKINMEIYLESQKTPPFVIKETTDITGARYSSVSAYKRLVVFSEPWNGYGEYEINIHLEGSEYP